MNALTPDASIFTIRISNRLQEPLEDLLYLSDALSLWLQLLDHQLIQTQIKMIFCSHKFTETEAIFFSVCFERLFLSATKKSCSIRVFI